MKIVTYLALVLFATGVFSSCKKEDDVSPENKQKAEDFKAAVSAKQFRLVEYYADKPIDYVEDDSEVRQDTDLWPYVSLWIKDDNNVFDLGTGKVTVVQNTHKYSDITDESFTRDFSVGADKNGAYVNFLNYQYNPLQYRIVDFNADGFTVYVDWHSGAKVFSKFAVVQ